MKKEDVQAKEEVTAVEIEIAKKESTDIESIGKTEKKQEAEQKQIPMKQHHGKKVLRWVLLVSVILLLVGYIGIGIYYTSHFLPKTYIDGMNCSNLDPLTVARMMEEQLKGYQLEIIGRNPQDATQKQLLGTITAEEIQLRLADAQGAAQETMNRQNGFLWITRLGNKDFSETIEQGVVFEEDLLETIVSDWDAFQNRKTIPPENAAIGAYSKKENAYTVISETPGTRLKKDVAIESIVGAIQMHYAEWHLDDEYYEEAEITTENADMQRQLRTANRWVRTAIAYDWNGNEVLLDGEQIQEWITFEKNGPVLDDEAIREYVITQAKEYDTYGKKRKFTTTLDVELTLPSGAYGWKVDRSAEAEELIKLIRQGARIAREPVYTSMAANKGSDDIGDSYVEIDLSNQHLYVYQDGAIVLETDFVSGSMNDPSRFTPPGVFGLTYKTRNAVLRGADYETPVNYWMPFNGNVGMHDATWRRSFGGTIYLTNGSHGCVNLPLNMAAEIYEYVSTGFPIICYYY